MLGVSLVLPWFDNRERFGNPGVVVASETVTTGLSFENVDGFWTTSGINLQNNYTDMHLSAKQVFVPDELSDLTEHFTYSLQEWHDTKARFWVTLTYLPSYYGWAGNPQLYPSEDLDALLGNSEWTNSNYSNNRFQISNKEVWANNQTEKGYICDITDFTDEESGFNVSWDITIRSHYYHIIIDYYLYFENSTGTYLVHEFEDVYSGERPDLLPVEFQINKYNDQQNSGIVDRALMRYDNLYGDSHSVNVTIAYPEGKTFLGMNKGTQLSEDLYYSHVVPFAGEHNETLLDSTVGYTIRSFTVPILNNTVESIWFKIRSEYEEFNDLRIWLTGSFAGGSGTSADPYQISNWTHLNSVRDNLDKDFILTTDIDSSTSGYDTYASSSANSGSG